MNLVPVHLDSIRLGKPLAFTLVNESGALLATESTVIATRAQLDSLAETHGGIYVDAADRDALQRAYLHLLQALERQDKASGTSAPARPLAVSQPVTVANSQHVDWRDLQSQTSQLLRETNADHFRNQLEHLDGILGAEMQRNPDGALLALIHLTSTETGNYSATHALLVSALCSLAAREVLDWPESEQAVLRRAALTMNISMTAMQDQLAVQTETLSASQRMTIDGHPKASVDLLRKLGVRDAVWLDAVAEHHHKFPGPLNEKTAGQRMARMIQRADMFAARLALRTSRTPISPAAAMQACNFDENHQVDEAGAAIIKAAGIYPPGSFVRLASDEIAVVVRRGFNTSTPKVAVVVGRNGSHIAKPIVRDSSVRNHRIVASVAHRNAKVQVDLDQILPLTEAAAGDRP